MVLLSAGLVLAVIGIVVQGRRVGRLERRLTGLTRGSDGGNLQDVLESHLDTVARVVEDVSDVAERATVLEARSTRAFSRMGLVRFNPFEDTGGNQSFALALLDGREDGVVISSLHTRTATRIYAKTVSGGQADAALSDEESRALATARSAAGSRSPESPGAVRGGRGPRLAAHGPLRGVDSE